jgi:Protein of unknown function (DUF3311)
MIQPTVRPRSTVAAHPITSAAIAILVAAPVFATLYSPIYSRITPKIGDFPFFYFYLLIFTPVTSLALWLAMLLQRRPGQSGDAPREPHGEVAK